MQNSPRLPESLGLEELRRMASEGDDNQFLRLTRLCENEDFARHLLPVLRSQRDQLDGWLGYLAELHPALSENPKRGA